MADSLPTTEARVMLDVNVLIAGTIWPRWQYAILQHALRGDFQLVLAPLILESARRNIRDIDARQLPRFERFLDDCLYVLVDNPTRKEVQQNLDLVRSQADVPIALAAIDAQVDTLSPTMLISPIGCNDTKSSTSDSRHHPSAGLPARCYGLDE